MIWRLLSLILVLFGGSAVFAKTVESSPLFRSGETLSHIYCASCHAYTPPEILPQRSWNILLRYMGLRLGVNPEKLMTGLSPVERDVVAGRHELLAEVGLLPNSPMLDSEEWERLQAYYMNAAPAESLAQVAKPELRVDSGFFISRRTQYNVPVAVTTLAQIDERNQQVMLGDSRAEQFTLLDRNLNLVAQYPTQNSLWVRAITTADGLYLLSIGDLAGAGVGQSRGNLFYGRRLADEYATEGVALPDLYRPSDMVLADLDGDGRDELVVCRFGIDTGSVTVHRLREEGPKYEETAVATLLDVPGAVAAQAHDFDGDGRLDIGVLISDARERFCVFLNRGNFRFEEHTVIESSAAFGYVGFKLKDMNRDGRMDLITVNGDNVDSDPYNTRKPYHGIRVYLGGDELDFTEVFFYPMYGAYAVEVEDFDLDGDYDLAAIAFNPDFESELVEGFVFLEERGTFDYSASLHPATSDGRWLTMDSGDLDGDGDKDLLLGAGYVPAGLDIDHPDLLQQQMTSGRPILYLENRTR